MDVIGRCKVDINSIKTKMPEIISNERIENHSIWQHIYSIRNHFESDKVFKKFRDTYDRTYPEPCFGNINRAVETFQDNFNEWLNELECSELIIKCYYKDNIISLVGFTDSASSCFLFPSEFVTVTEYRDYDFLTGQERKRLLEGQQKTAVENETNIINNDDISKNDLEIKQTQTQAKIDSLNQQLKDVQEAKVAGLIEIQAEIDAKMAELESKKEEMMSALNKKKVEMELALEKMKFDIFKLDSEIYAIRCYTGEILELKKIISGKCASLDTPMIFHQKMRYLDEELGKLASLYNVDYSDAQNFEEILKARKDIMEYFAPNERSIMLIRVSRTNKGYHHNYSGTSNSYNILNAYEKYHGQKVGIIIRDGDNLYIAWTDDERVYFSDDAFFKPGQTEATASDLAKLEKGKWESEEEYQKRMQSEKMKELRNQLGRYYVFTLLQGIIDRNIILFPEKVNIRTNSKYIVWSYADSWITTNEYGTFGEMIDRCNKSVKAGDMILTMDSIRPERAQGFYGTYVSQAYYNDRGRGEKNRTWDVSAGNNKIYPINLVEHSAKYHYTCWYDDEDEKSEETATWTDEEYKDILNREWEKYYYIYENIKKVENSDNYQFFISLEKNKNWETGKSARANFEVYRDEFINLTFMNSVWLTYVLTNHKEGSMYIHGESIDFAYIIPYIKKALEHTREREQQFASWLEKIDKNILKDDKWPVKLSEWMLSEDIHNFSEFRAKQFAKHYNKTQLSQ